MASALTGAGATASAKDLPGFGGVYQPINLNLYAYGLHNPVRHVDADGNLPIVPIAIGVMWAADKAHAAYEAYQDAQAIRSGEKTVGQVAQERFTEHTAGADPSAQWAAAASRA